MTLGHLFPTKLKLWQPNRRHVFHKTIVKWQFAAFFASALLFGGTTEGELIHTLLTWRAAKMSLF